MTHQLIAHRLLSAPKITQRSWHGGHYYEIDGQKNQDHPRGWFPSVTTVLGGGVPRPGLVAWAKKQGIEAMGNELSQLVAGYSPGGLMITIESVVRLMERASKRDDSAAQDYGTAAHALIAGWFGSGTVLRGPVPEDLGYESFNAFMLWLLYSGYEVVASELPVFGDRIAGTIDLLLRDDNGELIVADIKTGSGVYPEMAFQVAAYAHAASEYLDTPITRGIVLHLPRQPKDGEPAFQAHAVKDMPTALMGYRAAEAMRAVLAIKHFEAIPQEER